jgi:hypothetical protein
MASGHTNHQTFSGFLLTDQIAANQRYKSATSMSASEGIIPTNSSCFLSLAGALG